MISITNIIRNTFLFIVFVILVGNLPAFVINFSIAQYWQSVINTLILLTKPNMWLIYEKYYVYPLFPMIVDPLVYSIILLFSALMISLVLGNLITLGIHHAKKTGLIFKSIVTFIDAVPDVFYIVVAQLGVIWIYQQTGVLIFEIVSLGPQKAYFLPIVLLSIIPTLFFIKVNLNLYSEEYNKAYVQFLRSQGISSAKIYFHVLRNTWQNQLIQSQRAIWLMISNLFVLEIIFNMSGALHFLRYHPIPIVFIFILVGLTLFMNILIFLLQLLVPRVAKEEGTSW